MSEHDLYARAMDLKREEESRKAKKNKESLGDRMKDYEKRAFRPLIPRIPVLIRLDGKAFHSWTKGLERPFDQIMKHSMSYAMLKVCSKIDGARFGYCQSDEISILVCDYDEVLRQIEVNDTGDMDLLKDRIEQIEEKLNIKSKG